MYSLLIDYHSFLKSRRALFISSVITLLISASQFSGDGITIFGLTVLIEKEHVLITSRIATSYFMWVFFWNFLTEYYANFQKYIEAAVNRAIEISEASARDVDDEMSRHGKYEDGYHEPDGWWEAHYNFKSKRLRAVSRVEVLGRFLSIFRTICVDIAPAPLVGVFAILFPIYTTNWMFNYL